jgi:hypothetical protein
MPVLRALSLAALLLAACGGSTTTTLVGPDAAPADGAEPADGATQPPGDAGPTTCGSAGTCPSGRICVVTVSGGGACFLPDDAGICPNGQHGGPGCCDNTTTTYDCQPLPAACSGTLSCACASPSLCTCGCQVTGPESLGCGCLAP